MSLGKVMEKFKLFLSIDREEGGWTVSVYHTELPEMVIYSCNGRFLWYTLRKAVGGSLTNFAAKLRELQQTRELNLGSFAEEPSEK